MKRNILVLGAEGMLGQTVYGYLMSFSDIKTWGTARSKRKGLFKLSVKNYKQDFTDILKRVNKIDYVINCTGILKNYNSLEDLITVNSIFPRQLENLAEKFKLIHISTDMVFSPLAKRVTESHMPSPFEIYGASKFIGETSNSNSLTIRTSIIGFDKVSHRGLLEWAIKNDSSQINGFTNQLWTGCTTLQYAMLCRKIINRNSFENLRKKSNVLHFAPINPVSKYQLIKDFIRMMNIKKKIKKSVDQPIMRRLNTQFRKELYLKEFKSNYKEALKELIEYEKIAAGS